MLVIIGLPVDGVLAGKSLIDAATVRSRISRMEEHFTAIHAFQAKSGIFA